MNQVDLFKNALLSCENLSEKYPHVATIKSIIHQIEYLIQLSNGSLIDRSRLADIIIGVQAAREIEPLDQKTAELLHKVSVEAHRM